MIKKGNYRRWSTGKKVNFTTPTGVRIDRSRAKPYRAVITYRGKRVHLGWFETEEEANEAYNEAKEIALEEYYATMKDTNPTDEDPLP
jgi:hypothetical protein